MYPCPRGPLLRKQAYLGFCVNLWPVRVLVYSHSSPQEKARELFLLLLLLPHRALWSSSARSGSRLRQTAAERWITKSSPNWFRGTGVVRCCFSLGLGELYSLVCGGFFAVLPWRLSEVSSRCCAFSWLERKRRPNYTGSRVSLLKICCTFQENALVSGVYGIMLHEKCSLCV